MYYCSVVLSVTILKTLFAKFYPRGIGRPTVISFHPQLSRNHPLLWELKLLSSFLEQALISAVDGKGHIDSTQPCPLAALLAQSGYDLNSLKDRCWLSLEMDCLSDPLRMSTAQLGGVP